ncbi:hypothetical protein PG997_004515 [Apiospora hydei]|uniref:Centromere protein H C-terminal domain-containing protein n=1 Tax=Apiospora hydei TaxID=1337664 RepID=A0ABR1X2J7_9PEZI
MDDNELRDDVGAFHAGHVEDTLAELQQLVREHEMALQRARMSSTRLQRDKYGPEASLGVMRSAYEELSTATPFLPFPDSVLPALVALRKTSQTAVETKAFLTSHQESALGMKKKLESERLKLRDQEALARSLRSRIHSLRNGIDNRMETDADDIARERISELEQKKRRYDKETSMFLKSLRGFIDSHLASMLAAEDLGGPVVGDMMDLDDSDLAAGFSAHGKLKKAKEKPDQDKRQRRIDEIWGGRDEPEAQSKGESAAAASDLRDLTEELLNQLMESDGDSSAAYIQLEKESAAARFLVRSKVAQLHPRDSTKLRLVDFGRDLDE